MDNIKATINLNGMSENGLFWCQEMGVAKVGGKNILTPNFMARNWIDSGDTGYSGLTGNDKFDAMCSFATTATSPHNLVAGIYNGTKIYLFDAVNDSNHKGLAHTITSAESNYPDMIQTNSNHLLYMSARYMGIAYYFTATSATATSLTVSDATLNATYGIDNASTNRHIYNITKKEGYTNTQADPTDTLTFTTAAVTPQAGDVFICFVDEKFDFGSAYSANTKRQIVLFGSEYFILNDGYLASLDSTLTTFSATAKQLPYQTHANCISVNNSQMLIGGSHKNNSGKLMLWNGVDDGFSSILDISTPPLVIEAYQNGWLYFTDGKIFYTDGYQTTLVAQMPDTEMGMYYVNTNFNHLKLAEDKLFIGCESDTSGRIREGIYIYDLLNKSWSFTPRTVLTATPTRNTYGGCLYYHVPTPLSAIYDRVLLTSARDTISVIEANRNSGGNKQIIVGYMVLPRKIRISKIQVNLAKKYNALNRAFTNTDVTVSVGDGDFGFFTQATASDSSTGTSVYHTTGNNYPVEIGQEFEVVDGGYLNAGFRSWITDITNGGTANEVWTISPALPSAITTSGTQNLLIYNLKKCGTKTISDGDLLDNLTFTVSNFNSDKLYFQVMIDGTLLDIHSINIF